MSDLLERLRDFGATEMSSALRAEAADEIERLRAVEKAREVNDLLERARLLCSQTRGAVCLQSDEMTKLLDEIERLRVENTDLRVSNVTLDESNMKLRAEIERHREQLL